MIETALVLVETNLVSRAFWVKTTATTDRDGVYIGSLRSFDVVPSTITRCIGCKQFSWLAHVLYLRGLSKTTEYCREIDISAEVNYISLLARV